MTGSKHLGVIPFEAMSPDTYFKPQTDLFIGEVNQGDKFVVAFGQDDIALYLHLPGASIKVPLAEMIPQLYRGLLADQAQAAEAQGWSPFEREPELDREGVPGFINSIYEAWVDADDDIVAVAFRRRDGQTIFRRADLQRMAYEFAEPHWMGALVMPPADDDGDDMVIVFTRPPVEDPE